MQRLCMLQVSSNLVNDIVLLLYNKLVASSSYSQLQP
jgi:hypothetical protein